MSSVVTMFMIRRIYFRQTVASIDCLFLDVINAFPRLPSPESDARIKVRLGFLM